MPLREAGTGSGLPVLRHWRFCQNPIGPLAGTGKNIDAGKKGLRESWQMQIEFAELGDVQIYIRPYCLSATAGS